jgi:hypothetical protein
MRCKKCLELARTRLFFVVRNVPARGRAHENGLCAKHDREEHGELPDEDKRAINAAWALRHPAHRSS